jgi:GMP synthase (glutamine-hydrolysing)
MSAAEKVLICKHSRSWSDDRCSQLLADKGYQIDWCYPLDGEPLPEPEAYRAAVIFGCRNSVNDPEPWIKNELRWLEDCLKTDCAYLGLCFGGQLLAKVLGARVATHQDSLTEIGFTEIYPNAEKKDCLSPPKKLFQWHREGFDLPADATRLCSSERFPNQAFRYGSQSYGLQFHPEVNHAVIQQWFSENENYSEEGLDPASRARQLDYARQNDDAITDWFSGFIDNWLK